MLMSVGIELPKSIFAHGWWLMGDSKMSKSLGNIINPMDLIDKYGVDPLRYYLMREMVVGQDANFTLKSFIQRYNSDLANDFGNLLSRVTTLIYKNYSGKIPDPGNLSDQELSIKQKSEHLQSIVKSLIYDMKINEAIEQIMQFIRHVNRYMEQNAPWKMVNDNKLEAGRVLYTAGEALRISAILLSPIMPNRTLIVLEVLSSERDECSWGGLSVGAKLKQHTPLFPRIK